MRIAVTSMGVLFREGELDCFLWASMDTGKAGDTVLHILMSFFILNFNAASWTYF